MKQILLVGLGGCIGSIGRYKLGAWILHHHSLEWRFPLSTFTVNVVGCLVAGILAGLIERHDMFSAETRILLFTGFLGGFTTFSAFGLQTFHLRGMNPAIRRALYEIIRCRFRTYSAFGIKRFQSSQGRKSRVAFPLSSNFSDYYGVVFFEPGVGE